MNFSGNPESLFEVDEENLFADYNEDFFSKHRNYIKQAEVKLEKWEGFYFKDNGTIPKSG